MGRYIASGQATVISILENENADEVKNKEEVLKDIGKRVDLNLYDEKYKLNNANYAYPIALASNEFVGDKASFSFKSGLLCVIQSKD